MAHPKSAIIRKFIVDHVETHPVDIAKVTAEHFAITRQAVRRHLTILIEDGVLKAEGEKRKRRYLLSESKYSWVFPLADHREEDKVWRDYVKPTVEHLPDNVQTILHYGFTEMFNNVIDHSMGTSAGVTVDVSSRNVRLGILDDGVGIFEKIKESLGLEDHRQAILELVKGKFTTDPAHHSGQGIFFTSRIFDSFSIRSNHLLFAHESGGDDWLIEVDPLQGYGTVVLMGIEAQSHKQLKDVFDRYSDVEDEEYSFSKTHVPLTLAKYGNDQLISRSQAKRVLSRFERFEEVTLDFAGVEEIGQAFADEIFRVFRRNNPQIRIKHVRANPQVERMIRRAESTSDASR